MCIALHNGFVSVVVQTVIYESHYHAMFIECQICDIDNIIYFFTV